MRHWLRSTDERLEHFLTAWRIPLFVALIAIFLAVRVVQLYTRPLWFDELSTFHVSRSFAFRELPFILTHSRDSQPPLYHLLNMPFLWLLGDRPESIRWVSLIAAVIGLVALFRWLCRTVSAAAALGAAAFLSASSLGFYSTEARPYALWFCFLSLAIATEKLPLRILFLTLSGCVHFFGAIAALPLAFAEKTWPRRLAYVAILPPAIFSLLIAPSPEEQKLKPLAAVDWHFASSAIASLCGPILLVVLGALLLVRLPFRSARQAIVVSALLAAGCLAVLSLFSRLSTPFYPRYAFPLLSAIAIFLAWCIANSRLPGILAISILISAISLIPLRAQKTLSVSELPLAQWLDPFFSRYQYPFVTDSYFFVGLSWHLKDPNRARLHYAYDQPTPFSWRDRRIATMAAWIAVHEGQGRHDTFRSLIEMGQPFALLQRKGYANQFKRSLAEASAKITPLGSFQGHDLVLVEPMPKALPGDRSGSSAGAQPTLRIP